MFDLILARSRWATQVRYSLYIKRISTDEEAGRKPRWTSWSSCFSHVLHMTHTHEGKADGGTFCGLKNKKGKKKLSCKLTSPALACRCNSYKTRKMVVTPECVGVINTHRHMWLLFSLVAMRGQCYDILREPQLPPPFHQLYPRSCSDCLHAELFW